MAVQVGPLVALLGVVALMAAVVSYGIWQYRPRMGATWLTVSTFGVTVWSVGDALVIGATAAETQFVGGFIAMAAATLSATSWIVFSARYTGRDNWLTTPRIALLWLIPTGLIATGIAVPDAMLTLEGPVVGSLDLSPGPVFFALSAYGYLTQSAGIAILLRKLRHSRNVYRRRTFLFVLIGGVMLFGHVASITGVSPAPHTSLAPLSFFGLGIISALVIYDHSYLRLLPVERLFGLFGDRFEDLGPIARDVVIEEMGSGVVVLDANNRIVDLNPMSRRMLGADDERVVGERIEDVVDLEAFERDQPEFFDAEVREGRFDSVWVRSPDGNRRCYDVVLTDLHDEHDEVSGRVGIIHDVTEKQRQQQQLAAQTRKLTRQNKNLEEFAKIVSHDLRNPLTVASGQVEYAMQTGETEHLDTALNAHDRIEAIISDVLQLARQGKSVETTESISVAETARAAWEAIESDGATLELAADDGYTIEADRSRVQQVFENLFRNATEHATVDAPTAAQTDAAADGGSDDADEPATAETNGIAADALTVTVGPTNEGFYVEDNGPGIPEDRRDNVFVEGYSTDEAGTGLGLAIVSMIVDAHGWDIDITDAQSGGARFEVVTE